MEKENNKIVEEKEKDNVNPNHYKTQTSLECIEAMDITFGPKAVYDFCICNAYKYIWRWKNKNGLEDLKKARWYIDRALNMSGEDDFDSYEIVKRMKKYVENQYLDMGIYY